MSRRGLVWYLLNSGLIKTHKHVAPLPRVPTILACLEASTHHQVPALQWLADFTIRYLALLNCSTNCLVYCCAGKQFRQVLLNCLGVSRPVGASRPVEGTSLMAS